MKIQSLLYLLFVLVMWSAALTCRSSKARQILLLIASYAFYASWSGVAYLGLLIASTWGNYALGVLLRRHNRSSVLWLGLGCNLLLLGTFKYLPAFSSAFLSGSALDSVLHSWILPAGISFWTFQAMSYLFDIYREDDVRPTLLEFSLFLAFWPTVLSGPITRAGELVPQLREAQRARWEDIERGIVSIVNGLFFKLVLARLLGEGVAQGEGIATGWDQIASGWGATDVWLLSIGFGFQLFFDFAGYSLIVIGTALLFGIRLPQNFDRPFLSTTPSVFWTRWHMSLSFWIRDYVFLPLATLRREIWWRGAALIISMVIFGLWHGATLLFLAWGTYHGLLLAGHRILQSWNRRRAWNLPPTLIATVSWMVTFALVSLGWVFFRANSWQQAVEMLRAVVTPSAYLVYVVKPNAYVVTGLIVAGYLISSSFLARMTVWMKRSWLNRLLWFVSPPYYAALLLLIVIYSHEESLFVYLQF